VSKSIAGVADRGRRSISGISAKENPMRQTAILAAFWFVFAAGQDACQIIREALAPVPTEKGAWT
jgi:hypothetical protein